MTKTLLSGLLALSLAVPATASSDRAVGSLLDAKAAAAAARGAALEAAAGASSVFDGARAASPAGGTVLAAPSRGAAAPGPASAAPAPAPEAAPAAAPDVAPVPARGISDGSLGLDPESGFELGTGRCSACRGPVEGKWYFLDDVIATPKAGPPAIVWIGARELVEDAVLSADGTSVTLKDGTRVAFALVPKLASNRSYYDGSSLAYLKGRPLRVRGEYALIGGARTLVARSVWPEDWRIDAANIKEADAKNGDGVDALVAADKGGARAPFETRLLWAKDGPREWDGKPVMGFMLNGAQGDDDEALAGHSSLFTGRLGPNGSMADWMFDNFYDMNTASEKGIVAAMTPMDKYMTDLNSGQSWYRPSYLLVMVMKDDRVPREFQETFKAQYARYYSQALKYDHTHENCAALIADPVRADGWHIPEKGATPWPIAKALEKVIAAASSAKAGREVFETLREEPTRSFPRASFDAAGGDLLTLAGAYEAEPLGRELTPLERELREDLLAVVFVRLPQLPSSRAFGRDPAGSVFDYMSRTPLDHSKWKTVPSVKRPFPPPH